MSKETFSYVKLKDVAEVEISGVDKKFKITRLRYHFVILSMFIITGQLQKEKQALL